MSKGVLMASVLYWSSAGLLIAGMSFLQDWCCHSSWRRQGGEVSPAQSLPQQTILQMLITVLVPQQRKL